MLRFFLTLEVKVNIELEIEIFVDTRSAKRCTCM